MKFLTLTSLVTGALAGVIFDRDLPTIQGVLTTVGTNLVGLDTAVKAFTGDPTNVLTASNTLIQALKDGKAKVDPTGQLSLTDALGLQAPVKDLQAKGDALLADLKAKKDAIAQNGLCEATFLQASSINTASQALIDTVISKVPEAAQDIAKSLAAGLVADLKAAQDAFSPANCKDTGTPPPTSSAPGTSPPATTTPPVTTPPNTSTPPTTTTPPPGSDTCPAAQTVTVTAIDTKDCTPTPTCTTKAPVTVTTTKKACPTKANLPW
ncbi:cell wall galactomannoprotein Mp2/allergen F17-like protein [Pochonia chlamydosporia 170]|uniref:Cell wall galactomannoprotein Mp2/allergen F17-like protein n=1 Tax=Pochonia chlamydosporia 170 TaxID=1380566 RepID=A0A179F982_METCM|nr:cell wall galactomannoprotein Mp2/allergen F17-like protein [Pochonia chlamydosporia 170]OAQ61663.1 cell wall galactomannoprotein Mp2/allergen F17-like protein [Pochonia chlamydosporia 170]